VDDEEVQRRASQEEEEVDDEEVQRRRSSPMLGRVLVSPNTRGIRILKDPRPSLPSRQKTPRDPPDWDTQTAQNFKRRTRELVCGSSSKQELLVRNIHTTKESSRGAGEQQGACTSTAGFMLATTIIIEICIAFC
jgi:hypothetical protein